jgi:hypothetical protein
MENTSSKSKQKKSVRVREEGRGREQKGLFGGENHGS